MLDYDPFWTNVIFDLKNNLQHVISISMVIARLISISIIISSISIINSNNSIHQMLANALQ